MRFGRPYSRIYYILIALLICWLALSAAAVCIGPVDLSPCKALSILASLFNPPAELEQDPAFIIVLRLRLPRALLALLCGGVLAAAGAILQGALRNPLADPFTLGVSAGAACGASVVLAFPALIPAPPFLSAAITALAALAGALAALCATLLLGGAKGDLKKESIILAGIAVSTFMGALAAMVKALNEDSVASIVFWLMGSLQGRGWSSLLILSLTAAPCLLILLFSWRRLDVLSLGDDEARSLGLSCARTRALLLATASLMAAVCVSVCGIIAFIGLVVPHIARLLLGAAHGPLLSASFLGGGVFLLLADCLARSILDGGQELPVGVITALCGGPFFAFLIWRQK